MAPNKGKVRLPSSKSTKSVNNNQKKKKRSKGKRKNKHNMIVLDKAILDKIYAESYSSLSNRVKPTQNCSSAINEVDVLSRKLNRVTLLEEKVESNPYHKEELENAALSRVYALEAELIATKKALHEALVRVEELQAKLALTASNWNCTLLQKQKVCIHGDHLFLE